MKYKLSQALGIEFVIFEKIVDIGKPERDGDEIFISGLYKFFKSQMSAEMFEDVLKTAKLEIKDLDN